MKFGPVQDVGIAGTLAAKYTQDKANSDSATPSTFKRGGKVKKTGRAKVHKGERVLTKKQDRKYRRVMKSRGKR